MKIQLRSISFLITYYEENLSSSTFHDEARENPLTLHTLKEAYFNRDLLYDTTNRGNIQLVRVLISMGIIILLLSMSNYANLSTAKASIRKKEIGPGHRQGVRGDYQITTYSVQREERSVDRTLPQATNRRESGLYQQ